MVGVSLLPTVLYVYTLPHWPLLYFIPQVTLYHFLWFAAANDKNVYSWIALQSFSSNGIISLFISLSLALSLPILFFFFSFSLHPLYCFIYAHCFVQYSVTYRYLCHPSVRWWWSFLFLLSCSASVAWSYFQLTSCFFFFLFFKFTRFCMTRYIWLHLTFDNL